MKIYLAGRFSAQDRLCVVRKRLQELGHEVTSTWLDEPKEKSYPNTTNEERGQYARRDLRDIARSQILALDLLLPPSRGGLDVEFGVALADPRYKTTYIVGEPRNLFHRLAAKQFANWEEFICHVKQTSLG